MYVKERWRFFVAFALFCMLQTRGASGSDDTCDSAANAGKQGESDACVAEEQAHHSSKKKIEWNDPTTKQNEWKWIPEAEHRCNIVRMTQRELFETLSPLGVPPLHPGPLIILADKKNPRNAKFRELTSRDNITTSLPSNFNATLSSSNSFSAHRRTIPLTQYLDEIAMNSGVTLPDQLSNETWYLFGETYSDEWKELLKAYKLPPCHTCQDDLVALSFGIGNRGSGVQWHVHGPGFSEALWGRKHWIMYPHKPVYNPDKNSRHWMEYTYTSLSQKQLPYECTLGPGDVVYFPDNWYHATLNLDPYTAFVSTFTTEHL